MINALNVILYIDEKFVLFCKSARYTSCNIIELHSSLLAEMFPGHVATVSSPI